MKNKIIIVVEGGLVQNVYAQNAEFVVIDRDVMEFDEEDAEVCRRMKDFARQEVLTGQSTGAFEDAETHEDFLNATAADGAP